MATKNIGLERLDSVQRPSSNGHKPKQGTRHNPSLLKRLWRSWSGFTPHRRAALSLGGVGCFLLVLSLWHCTTALSLLTGSPWPLALCMAIGIDAGMVASEVAAIVGRDSRAKRWANAYMGVAIAMSMCLNGLGNVLHAPEKYLWAAIPTGVIIPGMVWLLAKATAYLWEHKPGR
jgi:hypothetical protein